MVGGGRTGLDPIAILIKELRVLGSFTYADEFAEVIALLADGSLQVADLTSEIASASTTHRPLSSDYETRAP